MQKGLGNLRCLYWQEEFKIFQEEFVTSNSNCRDVRFWAKLAPNDEPKYTENENRDLT